MTTFTYHKRAPALRSSLTTVGLVLAVEMPLYIFLIPLLPGVWEWIAWGFFGALLVLLLLILTKIFRTRFTLAEDHLDIAFGAFRLKLGRPQIRGAERYQAPLPRGVSLGAVPHYAPDQDTLYIVPDKHRLVSIEMVEGLIAQLPGRKRVEFTRLVLTLDEPEPFLAALREWGVPVAESSPSRPPSPLEPVHPLEPVVTQGAAIRLEGLVKRYGDFPAVQGINLTVAPGEVLAFLGANGAGKTTTIKMITGLLRPTSGRVLIEGHDLWTDGPVARRLLGYVPDVPLLHESLTAREFLWLMAGLYEMPRAVGRNRADELLSMLGMEQWGDHLIRHFSLGMKRKMAIAAALIHQPKVLLLDEVTNGLDPRAARDVKNYVAAAARAGTAVFLTTHVLDVAQELAHRIAIIDRGIVRAIGTLSDLRAQAGIPEANLEELFLALTDPAGVSA